MGYREYSDCVGCPMGCRHCGREWVKEYFCDSCDDTADEDNPLYYFESEELCESCLLERLISKECDDMDDTRCVLCGEEAETLYLIDGSWYCRDCALEQFEKVCIDD